MADRLAILLGLYSWARATDQRVVPCTPARYDIIPLELSGRGSGSGEWAQPLSYRIAVTGPASIWYHGIMVRPLRGDTGVRSSLFIMGIDGRGGGGAGAFFLRETRCVRAMKKRRLRGEYRSVCPSHIEEPADASILLLCC
jgi:hypothetical protein